MKAIVDRRKTGIPGSDATERVQEMGGPVAQRASRKQNQDGPVPLPIGKNTGSSRSRVQQDADDLPRPRQRRHLHGGVTLLPAGCTQPGWGSPTALATARRRPPTWRQWSAIMTRQAIRPGSWR